jgi:hypothetical protein
LDPSPILVAIRDDLARLEAAAACIHSLDEAQLAELYPLVAAAAGRTRRAH